MRILRSPRRPGRLRVLVGLVATGMTTAVLAQEARPTLATPGVTQENILREALAEFPGTDAVTFSATFAPGATLGRHRHPGTEVLHVLSGHGLLLQDGHAPRDLGPGMTVVAQPEIKGGSFVHELRNASTTEPLRTYVVILVDNGEPPAVPAD
jgi:quercetin dioxygenase-like cupin family protein